MFYLLAALACSWAATPSAKVKAATVKATPPVKDEVLKQTILAKFAKSKAAEDHFQVTVQGGTATITGKTGVVQRKGAATRMAKTAGARAVVNNIQVSKEGKEKASAGLRRASLHRSGKEPRSVRAEKR